MANSLDDLKKSLTELVQRSVKSVDQLAETIDARADMARMAAQIRSLRRQREEVIARIGRKVYTLHTKGKVQNTDVLADCKQVDALGKQIAELQAKIEQLRKGETNQPPVVPLKDETPLTAEEAGPAPASEPESAGTTTPEPEPEAAAPESAAPQPPESAAPQPPETGEGTSAEGQ